MRALRGFRAKLALRIASALFLCGIVFLSGYLAMKGNELNRLHKLVQEGYLQVESGITAPVIKRAETMKQRTALGLPWRVGIPVGSFVGFHGYDIEVGLDTFLDINFGEVDRLLCVAHFKSGVYKVSGYDRAIEACSRVISSSESQGKNDVDARFIRAMAYIKLVHRRANALGNAEQDLMEIAELHPKAPGFLEKIAYLRGMKGEKLDKQQDTRDESPPLFREGGDEDGRQKGF